MGLLLPPGTLHGPFCGTATFLFPLIRGFLFSSSSYVFFPADTPQSPSWGRVLTTGDPANMDFVLPLPLIQDASAFFHGRIQLHVAWIFYFRGERSRSFLGHFSLLSAVFELVSGHNQKRRPY